MNKILLQPMAVPPEEEEEEFSYEGLSKEDAEYFKMKLTLFSPGSESEFKQSLAYMRKRYAAADNAEKARMTEFLSHVSNDYFTGSKAKNSSELENLTYSINNTGGVDIKVENKAKKFDPNMGLNQELLGKMSMGINAGVEALNYVDNMLMGNKNFGAQSEAIDSAVHATSKALINSGNPYAMAVGAGLEVANFTTKATGLTVQGFDVNINNSGYGQIGHMESKSNRDFLGAIGLGGLFEDNIEKQLIDRNTQAQMALKAANISDDIQFEQEARMNSVTDIIKLNEIALAGGVDTSVLVAKKGVKIEKLKSFLKNKKETEKATPKNIYLKITTDLLSGDTPITIQGKEYLIVPVEEAKSSEGKVVKAKNGAKLKNIEVSEQLSIIPEGTLHKNKHHLDVEGVTKKGIPVITVEDDSAETLEDIKEQEDTIVQHAEIESQEVIYNKELTDYVEDSLKEWEESKEDSILIEVGKRICKELLFNTEDPDNLIKLQKV